MINDSLVKQCSAKYILGTTWYHHVNYDLFRLANNSGYGPCSSHIRCPGLRLCWCQRWTCGRPRRNTTQRGPRIEIIVKTEDAESEHGGDKTCDSNLTMYICTSMLCLYSDSSYSSWIPLPCCSLLDCKPLLRPKHSILEPHLYRHKSTVINPLTFVAMKFEPTDAGYDKHQQIGTLSITCHAMCELLNWMSEVCNDNMFGACNLIVLLSSLGKPISYSGATIDG